MKRIFLSYARVDVAAAKQLAASLSELGWTVWWDPELRAGDIWSETLTAELHECDCVLVLWSVASVQRPWVLEEARIGFGLKKLVPASLVRHLELPASFSHVQTDSLATWDGSVWHPEFRKLVADLARFLGQPPRPLSDHPSYPDYANAIMGRDRPRAVADLALPRSGGYFRSPTDWKDEVLYLLIPDRFSDGQEATRPGLDRGSPATRHGTKAGGVPFEAWSRSGGTRWQGGTLAGVMSKLEYLQGLGITTLWLWPVMKQRAASDTFHGFAVQDFLDVDPRLGTRRDLVELVAQAHVRGMRVILSGTFHHSGMNWVYQGAAGQQLQPPYISGRHPFGAWLDADERPVADPKDPDDAVWPLELQNEACYMRAGTGRLSFMTQDGDRDDAEYRRTDFFSLRTFDLEQSVDTLAACYRYWLALTDCDGFFFDLVHQVPREIANRLCGSIRDYAARLGKQNFMVLGEMFGSDKAAEAHYRQIGRTLHRSLTAILDNGEMRWFLQDVAKGLRPGSDWFSAYGESGGELGIQREIGSRHVSIVDDPDCVLGHKFRFAAEGHDAYVVIALALQLFSLGIPCLYYGTEQAIGLQRTDHEAMAQGWGSLDRFMREAMFGPGHPRRLGRVEARNPAAPDLELPGFGPQGTAGHHAFDETSPLYESVAALTAIRRTYPALRSGSQYQRQVAFGAGPFKFPGAGDILAWSRILDDEEVVCIVNPNAGASRAGRILVDANLNRAGSSMVVVFGRAAIDATGAGPYRTGVGVAVCRDGTTACLDIRDLPAASVVILSNRPAMEGG